MNHRQNNNNQRSERGRPKNNDQIQVIHPQRQQKAQQIKEYWTEHRITLIAYQAQYIYNKKSSEEQIQEPSKQKKTQSQQQEKKGDQQQNQKLKQKQKQKKRKGRKKADPQFQTGFLFSGSKNKNQLRQQIKIEQLVKQYSNLSLLFNQSNKDVDDTEVRQFMKIMLQLKNEDILHEFLPLYDLIYKEITGIQFERVQKQKDRTQCLKKIETKLHQLIMSSSQKDFKKFKQYLKNDLKQTLKLLYVQTYCFLAQKFNFNINQFYAQAFSITLQHNKSGNKKVKGE